MQTQHEELIQSIALEARALEEVFERENYNLFNSASIQGKPWYGIALESEEAAGQKDEAHKQGIVRRMLDALIQFIKNIIARVQKFFSNKSHEDLAEFAKAAPRLQMKDMDLSKAAKDAEVDTSEYTREVNELLKAFKEKEELRRLTIEGLGEKLYKKLGDPYIRRMAFVGSKRSRAPRAVAEYLERNSKRADRWMSLTHGDNLEDMQEAAKEIEELISLYREEEAAFDPGDLRQVCNDVAEYAIFFKDTGYFKDAAKILDIGLHYRVYFLRTLHSVNIRLEKIRDNRASAEEAERVELYKSLYTTLNKLFSLHCEIAFVTEEYVKFQKFYANDWI